MSKLPCREGEAYGRWVTGCPTCRNTGPSNRATRLTRGAFFSSPEHRLGVALISPSSPEPLDLKRTIRAQLRAARGALDATARAEASASIAERLFSLDAVREARTLAVYAPLGGEADPLGLLARLQPGVRVLFPRSRAGERRLRFAACAPVDLVVGPLGAREPPAEAPEVEPEQIDCVLVPGLGFSLDGHRLGRGGGHYDATLAAMPRASRIGVAFEAQLVASLPREAHDAPLDALVTEARTLRFARQTR